MAQSRRNMPPYEVMSSGLAALGTQTSASMPQAEAETPQSGGEFFETITSVRPVGMWARLQNPIVLRVPRGYAVMLGVALLLLIALSYWVGHHRGSDAATMAWQNETNAQSAAMQRSSVLAADPVGKPKPVIGPPPLERTVDPAGDAAIESAPGRDPRQRDLNYVVLASDNQEGATRLLAFLWEHGVDAAAFRYKNHGLFTVVALKKGFTAAELRSNDYRRYRDGLARLGEKWEATVPGGRSFIKQGMLADKFEGEKYTAMIVRKDPQ